MNVETLELIKENFELIKGEPEVNNIFPYVGQGKELPASNGQLLSSKAKALGVTPMAYKVKVLDPNQITLSAWDWKQQPAKLAAMIADPERLKAAPPILVHEKADASYEVIDGGHRRTAAMRLELPIKAIIISDGAYKALEKKGWRDTAMYRLANHFYRKGRITQ